MDIRYDCVIRRETSIRSTVKSVESFSLFEIEFLWFIDEIITVKFQIYFEILVFQQEFLYDGFVLSFEYLFLFLHELDAVPLNPPPPAKEEDEGEDEGGSCEVDDDAHDEVWVVFIAELKIHFFRTFGGVKEAFVGGEVGQLGVHDDQVAGEEAGVVLVDDLVLHPVTLDAVPP